MIISSIGIYNHTSICCLLLFLLFCMAESVGGVSHQPTAHVRGVWNSVVSWMKMATDFISKDNNGLTESVETMATRGKVNCKMISVVKI